MSWNDALFLAFADIICYASYKEIQQMFFLISFAVIFAVFTWGIVWRNSSILYETISRGDRSSRRVALTFDDGPHPIYTNQVLDILKSYDAKATFFCIGYLAQVHPEIVRRIHEEGHLIANHSYEHSWRLCLWTPPRVKASIESTSRILEGITGVFPRFYRPPFGIKTPPQMFAVWNMDMRFIGWTRWAIDGGRHSLTLKRTMKLIRKVRNGDIFLLHDGNIGVNGNLMEHGTHGTAIAEHLPMLITSLKQKGYQLTTLDALIGVPGNVKALPLDHGALGLRRLISAMLNAFVREHTGPLRLSLAIALGIVIGCSPFFGLHAFIGLMFASRLKLNRLATIVGTNISNPMTAPFVIVASIQVGFRILYGSWLVSVMDVLQMESVWHMGNRFIVSWLVGFPIVGAAVGLAVMSLLYPFFLIRQYMKAAG